MNRLPMSLGTKHFEEFKEMLIEADASEALDNSIDDFTSDGDRAREMQEIFREELPSIRFEVEDIVYWRQQLAEDIRQQREKKRNEHLRKELKKIALWIALASLPIGYDKAQVAGAMSNDVMISLLPSLLGSIIGIMLIVGIGVGIAITIAHNKGERLSRRSLYATAWVVWAIVLISHLVTRSYGETQPDITANRTVSGNEHVQTQMKGYLMYSSAGNPKAQGLELNIQYPETWLPIAGKRPHIVMTFVSEGGKGLESAMIMVEDAPSQIVGLTKSELRQVFSRDGMQSMIPEGARLVNTKETEIEGLPAGVVEFETTVARAGEKFNSQILLYRFVFGRKIITLYFGVGDNVKSSRTVRTKMDALRPIFYQMANSVVLPQLWENE